ncbi:MAG: MBL fold metallo-hydrolase [Desulfomonilaceae bacterium]|nr:MBL fold metallo-hydrolase [Desulfomonilaceae bacterium]
MSYLEVMEGLFFIQRGYLNGNHFALRSEEPVLIDTGYSSHFSVTESLLENLGIDVSRTRLIINTHCHCDHIGGNRLIQERSQCAVAMHEIGKHFIDTRNDWATWWKYFDQEGDFFECSVGLHDGDTLSIGPHEFTVIHTPGHACEGIVLYNKSSKVLISSDTLWEHDMAVMNVRVEGSAACFTMLESLRRIETLDVEMVYPGHGKPFADMGRAIADTKKRLQSFIGDGKRIGNDLLKKIIVYTLMMREEVDEAGFFDQLVETYWFRETVDLYFDGDYQGKYESTMRGLLGRGIVKKKRDRLYTIVKP